MARGINQLQRWPGVGTNQKTRSATIMSTNRITKKWRRRKITRMKRNTDQVGSGAGARDFFEDKALDVVTDNEEEEEAEPGFINDDGADLPEEGDGRRMHHRLSAPVEDEQEDFEALERHIL